MPTSRQEPRRKLMTFTLVYELQHKHLLGYINDLTLKGAMVCGEKALTADRHLILGIEFPEVPPDMQSKRVVIPARVAWSRPDEQNPENFNIGFEFTELSPENMEVIKAVLARYQFRNALEDSDS